jgi:hypothetical protein
MNAMWCGCILWNPIDNPRPSIDRKVVSQCWVWRDGKWWYMCEDQEL